MTHILVIPRGKWNGIEYLKEEQWLGRGPILNQAIQNFRIALLGDNEHAAAYWGGVAADIRRLEQITPQTIILITEFAD